MPEIQRTVEIPADARRLTGDLSVPPNARGVVVFAHGSGSGRSSPRNQKVARALQDAGLATLLLDLLGEDECNDVDKVYNVALLAGRLRRAADWLSNECQTSGFRLGCFGASTGAGAALVAAALAPAAFGAVVCRGGRPDLAVEYLSSVRAPTLLIVGENDGVVVELNERALRLLRCVKQLVTVPGASHLFEEPGTLDVVARLAAGWFLQHLALVDTLSPE